MSAEVHVAAGPAGDAVALRTALAAARVVHGIDDAAVQAFAGKLVSATFTGSAVLARGTEAVPGQDGCIEFAFGHDLQPGHRRDGGAMDFHERGFLHPAGNGAEIAHFRAAVDGVPGKTVTGRVLAAKPVRPAPTRTGPGVVVDANGAVTAARDGVVTLAGGVLDVVPLFVHKGNVDLHTGNLHSHGSVLVGGDLLEGFQIDADDDVEVKGCTFGGAIFAGGSVEIGLGIQAGSRIEAGLDLRCRHATSSTLFANGTIVVRDELVRCETVAAAVELVQGRGLVLGGAVRARDRIAVLTAGSEACVLTLLAVADLTSETKELQRKSNQLDRAERQAMKLAPKTQGPARGGKFGRSQMALQDAALSEKLALAKRQRELLATATIEIRGRAHLGVRIRLGTAERTIETSASGLRFRWDATEGRIVQEPT